MDVNQKTARTVGAFYIAATVAGAVSLMLTESALTADDYLTKVAANDTQVIAGEFFVLMMAIAVTGIGISVYPVLRKYHESIAHGYIAARVVEGILQIMGVISILLLVTLSQDFVKADAPDAAYYHTLGDLLLNVRDWGAHAALDVAVFPIGALLFYYVLYQAGLVPRWLSGWGIVAAIVYLAAGLLVMFTVIEPLSTAQVIMNVPLALQELALALWLIVKGFNT